MLLKINGTYTLPIGTGPKSIQIPFIGMKAQFNFKEHFPVDGGRYHRNTSYPSRRAWLCYP